jgi:hypothetical protein
VRGFVQELIEATLKLIPCLTSLNLTKVSLQKGGVRHGRLTTDVFPQQFNAIRIRCHGRVEAWPSDIGWQPLPATKSTPITIIRTPA